jgi:hypothetical protein
VRPSSFAHGKNLNKIIWLAALALVFVYGSGFTSFSLGGVMGYLNEYEQLSMDGSGDAACAQLHSDIEFSIDDYSSGRRVHSEGGKEELCAEIKKAAPAFKLVLTSMNVIREEVVVKHGWLHPWTADVSYTERRSISLANGAMQINTVGEDTLTLVKTFDGVKIKRLVATAKLAT